MTVSVAQAAPQAKDTTAARKRRRRAPAGGAADDCFTCLKRGVKCDRRRPYCSQCLEVSNECSGYKTQLTWGVGVASRGKLRGLSLPVAKAPPVTREPRRSPGGARARANSAAMATANMEAGSNANAHPRVNHNGHRLSTSSAGSVQWPECEDPRLHAAPMPSRGPMDIPSVSHAAASAPTTPYGMAGYDYLSLSHSDNAPPMGHGNWGSVAYSPSMVHSPDAHTRFNKFHLGLATDGLSSSVSSVNSDVDYMSPLSRSYPREELPFVNSPALMYDNYSTHQSSPAPQSPPSSINIDHSRAPTSCPGIVYTPSEHGSSLGSHHLDVFESQFSQKMMRECDGFSVPGASSQGPNSALPPCNESPQPQQQQRLRAPQETSPSPRSEPSSKWANEPTAIPQELATRMPFFVDYYHSTLCPNMVFIDGPSNPFRENVLELAETSPSLQHAICALSACNLRMKRKLSLGQDTQTLMAKLFVEKQTAEAVADTQIDDPALSEEYQHRNLAVHLLNQQLNDPITSSHDSVLATILLLCHYRMVESGVAKFQTQFAGIGKILSMRKAQQLEATSINDREPQLSGSTGLSGDNDNVDALPFGIENLVGCDRELFKTISRLGRLNLVSQHRPVQNLATTPDETHRPHSPFGVPMSRGHRGSISHGVSQPISELRGLPLGARFDGNGFDALLGEEDAVTSTARSTGAYDVHRAIFWKEWKEVRLALQSWQFDSCTVGASLPGPPTQLQVRDLGSLSEAFRYAGLLYTERLASPTLPSSHTNFQNLVSQVVYYATSLEPESGAEKFLLWPLFVAGSECVNELQQNIIRNKCRDMMSRSGYMNNLSSLDVLEKLWATELKESEGRSPGTRLHIVGRRSPFNWAKCIGGTGDMEWIMF
ncbi:putative transcriptional regulatory protein-like protein [Emericellopsis cladophorae]|uniref:Transcriptional regulatory protein-like protein n=1 Tax=Emericellopsis cladophorae TaxID=2686198 RepID=A0A9P9Y3R1_9HYPO|nr:putative transcriptional regulatory protein-like protein [Emericellopsis cladophorae]KAI6782384.1 putative transcriptional regulatory protein-like protein [Emericellopsis cladophorae]